MCVCVFVTRHNFWTKWPGHLACWLVFLAIGAVGWLKSENQFAFSSTVPFSAQHGRRCSQLASVSVQFICCEQGFIVCYWTFSPVSCTLGTRSNVVYNDALLCRRYEIIQHAQRLWSRIFRSHVFHSRLYQPMSPCAIKLHLIRLLQNALYCVLCGCSPVGHESQESLKIFLKYTKMRKQGLPRLAPRPQVIEHSWPCDFPSRFNLSPRNVWWMNASPRAAIWELKSCIFCS